MWQLATEPLRTAAASPVELAAAFLWESSAGMPPDAGAVRSRPVRKADGGKKQAPASRGTR